LEFSHRNFRGEANHQLNKSQSISDSIDSTAPEDEAACAPACAGNAELGVKCELVGKISSMKDSYEEVKSHADSLKAGLDECNGVVGGEHGPAANLKHLIDAFTMASYYGISNQ